jgi:hypothetical protein
MKTALQELIEIFNHELKLGEATLSNDEGYMLKWAIFNSKTLLEKEKDQIQKAFSDGQETPINHPTLPHYSREEYYDDNYKPETI